MSKEIDESEHPIAGEPVYYSWSFDPELPQIRLVVLSDAHRGNPLFSEPHFMRAVSFIKDNPDVYAICNGDLNESAIRTSKGEIFKQAGTPQDQRDWMIERLSPIKDKILGMTTGNHELRIWNDVGVDLSKDIAKELHVPYRAEGLMMKFSIGCGNSHHPNSPYVFWVYQTHGYGGARTKGAKAVKVERLSAWLQSDLYVMSHDHEVNVAPVVSLHTDKRTYEEKDKNGEPTGFRYGRMKAQRKMLLKANAFLKWGGYSEMGGYAPVDLSVPTVGLLTPSSPWWEMVPDKAQQAVKVIV